MASMGVDQRQWMEATAAEDKFPEGLRVLAVDDDCVSLKALDVDLRLYKYHREWTDPSTPPLFLCE